MLYMYCCGGREEQQMMLWSSCVWYVDGWRVDGGGTNKYTYKKERKRLTQRERRRRTGTTVSIQRACRVENK